MPAPTRINSLTRYLICLQINLRHSRMASLHLSQLLLDLDVDIALIQEPYAVFSDHGIDQKYVPDNYIALNSTDQHAYGASILVKKSLNAQILLSTCTNATAGVKISVNSSQWFFFSLYCRPSIKDLCVHLTGFASTLPTSVLKRAFFCLDSNAKNPSWNSAMLDSKGKVVEEFFEDIGANVPLKF